MSDNIILVAETGSDLSPQLAAQYGIHLVPMHVSMGGKTLDDGSFPPEDVCAYYDSTGKVPQTSASAPADFERVFDEIHAALPQAKILHLAYSAVIHVLYNINNGVMNAFGYTFYQMIINVLFVCGFRIPWMAWVYPLYPSPEMMYVIYPISFLLVLIVNSVCVARFMHRLKKGETFAI